MKKHDIIFTIVTIIIIHTILLGFFSGIYCICRNNINRNPACGNTYEQLLVVLIIPCSIIGLIDLVSIGYIIYRYYTKKYNKNIAMDTISLYSENTVINNSV